MPQHLSPPGQQWAKSSPESVASRSVRMRVLFSIAEPIPARERHLHSRAHGLSHGLPADADVDRCGCDAAARPPIRPFLHSQHPDCWRERTPTAVWMTDINRENGAFALISALFLLGVRKPHGDQLRGRTGSRGTPCASLCQMDFL